MKKTIWIVVAVLCVAVCAVSGVFLGRYYLGLRRSSELIEQARVPQAQAEPQQPEPGQQPETTVTRPPADTSDRSEIPPRPEDTEQPRVAQLDPVQIPVDFDALHAINPEIYAWVTVPGTELDFPVAQSETDDLFYNSHGADGKYFILGAVFSQKTYNTKTFEDPMTFLYGHSTVYGQPGTFVELNSYADQAYFDEHRQIIIYTPENMFVYTVYAATVHNNEHILHYYDFSNEAYFDYYFEHLADPARSCDHTDPEIAPEFGDRLLTLSTCYAPDKSQRYLITGVLTGIAPAAAEVP